MKSPYFTLVFLCLNLTLLAQVPFNCTGDFYTSLTTGNNNSSLHQVTVDVNNNVTFTTINGNIGAQMNAIGYRVTDNLIYGVHPTQEDMFRIDATGTATFLTNLSNINASYQYFAGDVTPDGNYLVIIGRSSTSGTNVSRNLVKIDLNSPTYTQTSINLVNASNGAANTTVYVADIAYDPITGILYGYDNNGRRLVTIDDATGAINSSLFPTTAPWLLGALFFDPSGELFGYGRNQNDNTQDDFFYIDINTGLATFLTTGPSAGGNDGCSCPYTMDFKLYANVDTIHPCEEFYLRYIVVNTTGLVQTGLTITDTLPAGYEITQITQQAGINGTFSGIGSNIVDYSNVTAPLGISTLRVLVKAPATALGNYASQATLSGLPVFTGGTLISDDPTTLLQDDPTTWVVAPNDLGSNIVACNSDTVTIGIDSLFGSFTYVWNTNDTTTQIDVTQDGSYILNIANGTCVDADTIDVAFMNTAIDLGNDTTICHYDTLTLDATFPNVTYLWQDGSTNPTFAADTAGTYWCQITDSIGCTVSDTIVISNHAVTQIDLGTDLMYVCDSTTFTVYPNYTTGGFLWSDGSTNATFTANSIGTYDVIFTDANTCISRDTIVLFAPPVPTVNLGNDTILCFGNTLTLDAFQPYNRSVLWQDGSNNSTFIVNSNITGTYHVAITDTNGCQAFDTISVVYNEAFIDLQDDTTICHYDTLVLNASFPNVAYVWQDGSTNPTFSVTTSGTYWAELTDSIGCTYSDTTVITEYIITPVTLGADLMYVCDSASSFTLYPNYSTGGFLWSDGSANPTFSAPTIGTYHVEYTNANTCVSRDTIELYAPPIPSVNIGVDTIICHGDTLTLDAYEPFARSFVWQDGSTDTTFIVNSNNNGTYHVMLTDTNGCQAFDTITVLYNHVTPQLRADTSICYDVTIPVDGSYPEANITYLWSTGETTTAINVNQDTTYWLQLTDSIGCIGVDTFVLSHHPSANLGEDIEYVCDSVFQVLDPGVPAGTFLWHDGSTNPTFLPTMQGTYWVEIWDINGCYSTDTVTLVPVTSPTAYIGLDSNICIGQTVVLDATTDFIREYVWQDSSGLATFDAIATGEYIVEVIDSNGCNDFDTVMIWVNEVIPDLGADTAICDQTQLTLDATQPNIVSYLWQDNSTNNTFTASAGLYYVTLTDTLGCQGTDSIFISYRQTADLGPDITFICDSLTFDLSANIAGVYQWSTGQPDSTISNSQAGSFYINIIDEKGCFSSDTVEVVQISYPTVDLGNDTTYCIGNTYLLDASQNFIRSYAWQDGSSSNTFLTNTTGLYHVELTDSNGCKTTDSVMVYVNEVVVNLGNDTTICQSATITYNATQPNMTYLWQDGSTNPTFTVTTSGVYSVTVTDTIGCNDTDNVTVSEFAVIDLGPDRLFKCDSTLITIIPNLNTGDILWNNTLNTPIYITNQPETVTIIYEDANNCVSYDTLQILAPPTPPIDLGGDTVLCEFDVYTISIYDGVGRSYLWHDGSTNDNFTITQAGVYYAEITDTNGCINSDTIYIDYFLNQDLDLGNDTLICENIALQLSLNVTDAVRYEWQDGTEGADYTIFTDGTYWVNAYNIYDCPISDTIVVTTEPVPSEILYLPTDTIICNNNVITVRAYAPYATNYLWEGESAYYDQNDPFDSIFIITYPGTYSVTASNRCAGITQYLEVYEEDCGCYPFIPNGFTPNSDGRNDEFRVFSNCELLNFEMNIFDRWGNRVFGSTDWSQGWDGNINGQSAPQGVYVWQIKYAATDERGIITERIESGDVTLVR